MNTASRPVRVLPCMCGSSCHAGGHLARGRIPAVAGGISSGTNITVLLVGSMSDARTSQVAASRTTSEHDHAGTLHLQSESNRCLEYKDGFGNGLSLAFQRTRFNLVFSAKSSKLGIVLCVCARLKTGVLRAFFRSCCVFVPREKCHKRASLARSTHA